MNSQHIKQVILTTLALHASRMALKSTKFSEKGRQFNVQTLKNIDLPDRESNPGLPRDRRGY